MAGSYKPPSDAPTGPRASNTPSRGRGRGDGGSSRTLGMPVQRHQGYDDRQRNQQGRAPGSSSSRGFDTSHSGHNRGGRGGYGGRPDNGYYHTGRTEQTRGHHTSGFVSNSESRVASEAGDNLGFGGQRGSRGESEANGSDKTQPQQSELTLLEHEYVPQTADYIDQDELSPDWGYGASFTHCLDCGESKADGHLDNSDGCSRPCVRCEVKHKGTRCPKLYMTRAQWKKRGPRGTAPSLEVRLEGCRVRPNQDEAAELVRRGYTMFEHMYERGDSSLKRRFDEGSASPASHKKLKLADHAQLKELKQAAAEQRSRLKHVGDEGALLQEDIAKAKEKQAKADAAYADALAVKKDADAAVALLADQLKQNRLAAEETERLQRELEARRRIRDRRDKDTPSPGNEPGQLIKKEPSS